MAKEIWKFPLEPTDQQSIAMPAGASLLHVSTQFDQPCLWALVDPASRPAERTLRIYGTGQPLSDDPGRYIGTFMLKGEALVFHAFEAPTGG